MTQYWETDLPHPSTAGYCPGCGTYEFVLSTAMEVITCPNCQPHLCSPEDRRIKAMYLEEHGHWGWVRLD